MKKKFLMVLLTLTFTLNFYGGVRDGVFEDGTEYKVVDVNYDGSTVSTIVYAARVGRVVVNVADEVTGETSKLLVLVRSLVVSGRMYKDTVTEQLVDELVRLLVRNNWTGDMLWNYIYWSATEGFEVYSENGFDVLSIDTDHLNEVLSRLGVK